MNSPKEQFSSIYDQYIEKIYRFVYLKVDAQEVAEDITSRVFLNAWQAYQKNQKIRNIGAFLYKIARNIIVDHYRGKGVTKTVSIDYIPQIADNKTNIYEKAVLNADIDAIRLAIQNLKKDYQDVLIWYYLDDMPSEKIAELLDKPVGTVRVIIHRGLQMLRDELRGQV